MILSQRLFPLEEKKKWVCVAEVKGRQLVVKIRRKGLFQLIRAGLLFVSESDMSSLLVAEPENETLLYAITVKLYLSVLLSLEAFLKLLFCVPGE